MARPGLAALCLLCSSAWAENPIPELDAWEEKVQFECNAPFENVPGPKALAVGNFSYEYRGATVKVRRAGEPRKGPVKLGVLAGIKAADAETRIALKGFLSAFEAADVDAILIGGDTAEEPEHLDEVYQFLGEMSLRPMLSIAGNTERAGSHNYAIAKARKAGHTQLLNSGLIRRFDGDGFDVVSLSGYHDKSFLHLTGGCIYDRKALDGVEAAARAADDPVVLLVHGPPKQAGKVSIDYVPGVGNVGDPQLTELIKKLKIPFGVFGHILEAGGRATDLAGKLVPQKKAVKALYLNQGSASAVPWKMNDGSFSYGLAAVLTLNGAEASYEVLRAPKPPPQPFVE